MLRYREIGAFAASPVMTEDAYERLLDIMEQAGGAGRAARPTRKSSRTASAEQVMQEESSEKDYAEGVPAAARGGGVFARFFAKKGHSPSPANVVP